MASLRRKGILKIERIIARFIVASNIMNTQNRLFLQSRLQFQPLKVIAFSPFLQGLLKNNRIISQPQHVHLLWFLQKMSLVPMSPPLHVSNFSHSLLHSSLHAQIHHNSVSVCQAMVTKYHELSGSHNRNLWCYNSGARNLRSRYWQAKFPLKGQGRVFSRLLSWFLAIPCLRQHNAHLHMTLHAYICVHFPLLIRRPVVLYEGLH